MGNVLDDFFSFWWKTIHKTIHKTYSTFKKVFNETRRFQIVNIDVTRILNRTCITFDKHSWISFSSPETFDSTVPIQNDFEPFSRWKIHAHAYVHIVPIIGLYIVYIIQLHTSVSVGRWNDQFFFLLFDNPVRISHHNTGSVYGLIASSTSSCAQVDRTNIDVRALYTVRDWRACGR